MAVNSLGLWLFKNAFIFPSGFKVCWCPVLVWQVFFLSRIHKCFYPLLAFIIPAASKPTLLVDSELFIISGYSFPLGLCNFTMMHLRLDLCAFILLKIKWLLGSQDWYISIVLEHFVIISLDIAFWRFYSLPETPINSIFVFSLCLCAP